jgi:hypothetical protein
MIHTNSYQKYVIVFCLFLFFKIAEKGEWISALLYALLMTLTFCLVQKHYNKKNKRAGH